MYSRVLVISYSRYLVISCSRVLVFSLSPILVISYSRYLASEIMRDNSIMPRFNITMNVDMQKTLGHPQNSSHSRYSTAYTCSSRTLFLLHFFVNKAHFFVNFVTFIPEKYSSWIFLMEKMFSSFQIQTCVKWQQNALVGVYYNIFSSVYTACLYK